MAGEKINENFYVYLICRFFGLFHYWHLGVEFLQAIVSINKYIIK